MGLQAASFCGVLLFVEPRRVALMRAHTAECLAEHARGLQATLEAQFGEVRLGEVC